MSRAFNFSAGPAALPEPVLRQVQAELLEWQGERASVMEVSHRGQAFIDCAAAAERDLRELMAIPDDYHVLFLQGGATTLSALLALNLAGPQQTADFVLTGHWGEKALEQVLTKAGEMISGLSHCAGVVLADKQVGRLKHIEFVPLEPGRALVILVGED